MKSFSQTIEGLGIITIPVLFGLIGLISWLIVK